MSHLPTGYAVSFNRKYRRHGQLFLNLYKSILCQQERYLLELVRYIHLNPLRAGLVEDINHWRNTHGADIGTLWERFGMAGSIQTIFWRCLPIPKKWLGSATTVLWRKEFPPATGLILLAAGS